MRSKLFRHDVDTQTDHVLTTDLYVSRNGFRFHAYPECAALTGAGKVVRKIEACRICS